MSTAPIVLLENNLACQPAYFPVLSTLRKSHLRSVEFLEATCQMYRPYASAALDKDSITISHSLQGVIQLVLLVNDVPNFLLTFSQNSEIKFVKLFRLFIGTF